MVLSLLMLACFAAQDVDKILERGEKLLEEAKAAYEEARSKSSVASFVDAGFKLEEARIKFIVLQEIGTPEKQKTAGDRLRVVNQLSKLIHDGKVAVTGAPAESRTPKPSEPSPPPGTDAKPPAPVAVDVLRRAPIPDASKVREAEKIVKDLFSEQYSKKAPADRKALARELLQQVAQNQGDLAAAWLLCREAQDIAIQTCEVRTIVSSIETAARLFDVDAMAMKTAALNAAAKTAKTPEEHSALVDALLSLIEDLVGADQYEPAEKAAAAAVLCSRKANSPALAAHAATRSKEVSEAKTLFQGMKSVLETLAREPDNPSANLEVGQFLCYVKGNWELGLRFALKGSDPALKALAEKEGNVPLPAADQVDLADSWCALAEKEKSPLRKGRMLAHARTLYEGALPESSGLTRARLEKRLSSLDAGPEDRPAIDLLKLVDPVKDALKGTWTAGPQGGLTPAKGHALLQLPYLAPEEYDLRMVAIPGKGTELYFSLTLDKVPFDVSVDAWAGTVTGIGNIDGKMANANETSRPGQYLKLDAPNAILISVRRGSVIVTVNGERLIQWKADRARLSVHPLWVRPVNGTLAIGAWIPYTVTKLELIPVTGKGKATR